MASKARPTAEDKGGTSNGVLPKLKSFYEFMNSHGLDALELDEAGMHVKLVRRKSAPVHIPVPVTALGLGTTATAPETSQRGIVEPAPAQQMPAGSTMIKAPMMGIFYRAASPSSPPYAKEGDKVQPGQIMCMIEAMKVFNEIKADYPATILKVLLENGKPVKSGQDIFLVARG